MQNSVHKAKRSKQTNPEEKVTNENIKNQSDIELSEPKIDQESALSIHKYSFQYFIFLNMVFNN